MSKASDYSQRLRPWFDTDPYAYRGDTPGELEKHAERTEVVRKALAALIATLERKSLLTAPEIDGIIEGRGPQETD